MNKTICLTILFLLSTCGCASQLPPVADEQTAVDSLSKALEAWKGGDNPESLQKLSPPIFVNEQLWSRGATLLEFSISNRQLQGQAWNCEVALKVRQADGQTRQRTIEYRIDTQPSIVIVQQP